MNTFQGQNAGWKKTVSVGKSFAFRPYAYVRTGINEDISSIGTENALNGHYWSPDCKETGVYVRSDLDRILEWTSSDKEEKYVKINQKGTITGKSPGTATITLKALDGSGISCKVTVTVVQPVKSFELSFNGSNFYEGDTRTIKAYAISPSNATNKNITWSSSKPSVAKIDKNTGKITAVKEGTTTITATASDGYNAKRTYTIKVLTWRGKLNTTKATNISVGTYKNLKGNRTFTILNQNEISGWGTKCNRAACAIIASGFSKETPQQLVDSFDEKYSDLTSIYEAIPKNSTGYWTKYNLKVTNYYQDLTATNYQSIFKNQLKSGGYVLFHLDIGKSYIGKSGEKWTGKYHWLAIIDYKEENGKSSICVADWRGIRWVGIDEFQNGVYYAVLVNPA